MDAGGPVGRAVRILATDYRPRAGSVGYLATMDAKTTGRLSLPPSLKKNRTEKRLV